MRTVAIMIVVILLIQTCAAREETIWIGPQNPVYPLKIWMEKFSLNFVFNQTEKAQKMLDMADERLTEAEMVENSSTAFGIAMNEYADQLGKLQEIIKKDTDDKTKNIRINIKEKIEEQKNRTRI